MSLTIKQERFCHEYLIDLNATQAAIRAGYSERRADQIGYENLRKPEIQFAVKQLMQERSRRTGIKADDVIQEVARIAFANMGDFATWGPAGVNLTDSEKLTAEQRAMVAEITETVTANGGSKRIKLKDSLKALELLGRHLHLWDRQEGTEKRGDWRELLAVLRAHGRDIKNPNLNIDLSEFEGRY